MKKFILILCLLANSAFADVLHWSANNPFDQVTSYNVYVVKHGALNLVATVIPPATSVDITNFLSGNRTNFVVTAVNVVGESLPSAQVTDQRH